MNTSKSTRTLIGNIMAKAAAHGVGERYAPMPKGVYPLTIKRVELKPNKNRTGRILSIAAATDSNRWVWANLNVEHPNPEAEKIAFEQFSGLIEQLDMKHEEFVDLDDFNRLVEQRIKAYVGLDESRRNVITNFKQATVAH